MALIKKPMTGMKDILPKEMQIRDYLIGIIKETYSKFGFTSIETPAVENIANLSSKQGGENEKLIFKIMKRGEKLNLEILKTNPAKRCGGCKNQFYLRKVGWFTEYIYITLVKLSESAFLRSVCSPYASYLKCFKR